MLDLSKLHHFYIAAKYQNITRAAQELYISQPALTKTIKTLEDEIGLPLFYKKGRHVYLTEHGRYLKERCERLFSILDDISDEFEKIKENAESTIKLNVLTASVIVSDAVVEYTKKNKSTHFRIIQNTEVDCDISITTNSVNFSHLPAYVERDVIEERIYLATPKTPEYDMKEQIDLAEVREKGFVNLSGSRLFRIVCDKFCDSVGFTQNVIFESDSPATMRNLIKAGVGIGFWPEFSWSEFPSSDVNLIPISNPVCRRDLVIGLHNDSSTARDFYRFLLKYISEHEKPVALS